MTTTVLETLSLAVQGFLLGILSVSFFYNYRTRKNIDATLQVLHGYRREIAWFEARLDALEKKYAEKNWQVIEGKSNGRNS